MKKTVTILFVTLCFLSESYKAKAQIIESMEGAASGIGEILSDPETAEILVSFIDVLWQPTYGLFFGFEGEYSPNAIDFARYPYEFEDSGIYLPYGDYGYRGRGQFIGHYQNNGDVFQGVFSQLKYSPWPFLTLDVNHLQLFEQVEDDLTQSDRLSFTNFHVHYNRIRNRIVHGWWGLGITQLKNEDINYISPSFALGTTIYFAKPMSLYADMQTSYPNGALAVQTQVRMQVHLNRYLLYGGYQGIRVGEVFEPSFSIGAGVHF